MQNLELKYVRFQFGFHVLISDRYINFRFGDLRKPKLYFRSSETSQFLDIFDGWSLMYRKWPNKENWQPSLFDVEKHC